MHRHTYHECQSYVFASLLLSHCLWTTCHTPVFSRDHDILQLPCCYPQKTNWAVFLVGLSIFSVIYSGERSSFLFSPVERRGIFYEWKKFWAVTKLFPLLSVKMLFEQTILHGRFIQLWLIGLSLHRPPLQDQIPHCKPPPPWHQKHVSYYILWWWTIVTCLLHKLKTGTQFGSLVENSFMIDEKKFCL